ncbi:Para-Rep [Seminavis robusta]|uniref:Para-Rep n=1 Tax=Seminavis robusta TaxID=568900 RepID=A0A9N8F506_9STRA|nr:Para-Rep [Seminavis robusta]|eukprot:Sro3916_g351880.1 Para-Rep (283) ;mRNA; r:249-1097
MEKQNYKPCARSYPRRKKFATPSLLKKSAKAAHPSHLQGFTVFIGQKSLTGVKKVVGNRAYVEVSKGNEQQNYDYSIKDGDYEEFGSRDRKRGKHRDIEEFKKAVEGGERDIKRLRLHHSEVCAKYPRFVNEFIRDIIPEPQIKAHPLYPWQQQLYAVLKGPADDRTIHFIVDTKGNKGKSWFAKYYCSQYPDKTHILRPTKHADMAYALPYELKVIFIDCTRKQVEYMPYTFMEELKHGLVFNSKYESCVKKYTNLHVVVLMNQFPDMEALSEDRYNIIEL